MHFLALQKKKIKASHFFFCICGSGSLDSPREIVKMWMNKWMLSLPPLKSSSHRILCLLWSLLSHHWVSPHAHKKIHALFSPITNPFCSLPKPTWHIFQILTYEHITQLYNYCVYTYHTTQLPSWHNMHYSQTVWQTINILAVYSSPTLINVKCKCWPLCGSGLLLLNKFLSV